jgi:hypothetical protein
MEIYSNCASFLTSMAVTLNWLGIFSLKKIQKFRNYLESTSRLLLELEVVNYGWMMTLAVAKY